MKLIRTIEFIVTTFEGISSGSNISAEIMPSISYSFSKISYDNNGTINKSTATEIDYGLRTNGVNLTLSFKIGK